MRLNNNQQAFFALVKAGLWEQEVRLLPYGKVDYSELMRLAEEQSVVGLVAAGLEHLTDVRASKEDVLQFVSHVLRDFRNYIHPYQQMSERFSPDANTAKICLQVMKGALLQISQYKIA